MPRKSRKSSAAGACELDRRTICEEAARVMVDHGVTDYQAAKRKAVQRLGLSPRRTDLPSNREIGDAMRVRLRLFDGEGSDNRYRKRLERAAELMGLLEAFRPRMVGPLLDGIATEHGTVELHLFSDAPEDVMLQLDDLGLSHVPFDKRVRFPGDRYEQTPGFAFEWRNSLFEALVFKCQRIRQAPLCPVEGRPMRRASADRVVALRQDLATDFSAA